MFWRNFVHLKKSPVGQRTPDSFFPVVSAQLVISYTFWNTCSFVTHELANGVKMNVSSFSVPSGFDTREQMSSGRKILERIHPVIPHTHRSQSKPLILEAVVNQISGSTSRVVIRFFSPLLQPVKRLDLSAEPNWSMESFFCICCVEKFKSPTQDWMDQKESC